MADPRSRVRQSHDSFLGKSGAAVLIRRYDCVILDICEMPVSCMAAPAQLWPESTLGSEAFRPGEKEISRKSIGYLRNEGVERPP